MNPILKTILAQARARVLMRRFGRDRRGLAAVEFALILPFLLLLYLGVVEVTQGVILNRKTTLAAATVSNIVAQYTTISSSSQVPDILKAANQIFAPYSTSQANVIVSCISIDANGKATVAWSNGLVAGTARPTGQSVTVPTALDIPNTSIVLGEASYAYKATFDFLHLGTINLYSPVYMSPRASTTITETS